MNGAEKTHLEKKRVRESREEGETCAQRLNTLAITLGGFGGLLALWRQHEQFHAGHHAR
jgi:hypothetical protein